MKEAGRLSLFQGIAAAPRDVGDLFQQNGSGKSFLSS